jgi:hypothetical protein
MATVNSATSRWKWFFLVTFALLLIYGVHPESLGIACIVSSLLLILQSKDCDDYFKWTMYGIFITGIILLTIQYCITVGWYYSGVLTDVTK